MSASEWHQAVRSGSSQELHQLIGKAELRAKISQKDAYGQTPLHIACTNGIPVVFDFSLSINFFGIIFKVWNNFFSIFAQVHS